MLCKKCGNKIEANQKVCEKCGNKILNSKKIILAISVTAVIIVIVGILIGLRLYGKNIKIGNITLDNPMINLEITDEWITNKYKENGFDSFDDVDVKIMCIEDIEYNGFNKLVLADTTVKINGIKKSMVGFLLVNKKEDKVEGIACNNHLLWLLSGLRNSNEDKKREVLRICSEYIQTYGADIFSNIENKMFNELVKEISNVIGIIEARKYVNNEAKASIDTKLNYTLLFEKESAFVKYIAYYEEKLQFNPSWPINENTYKYFSKDYSYRKTLNSLEYIHGAPYVMIGQYEVWSTSNEEVVGTYSNLESAKDKLDVQEWNETGNTKSENNIKNEESNSQIDNSTNSKSNEINNNELAKTEKEKVYYSQSEGFDINDYLEDFKTNGLKYKITKVEDFNYKSNEVVEIIPNSEYVEKGSTIEFKVADNTYDMNIRVDTQYLLKLAKIDLSTLEDRESIQLTLKINDKIYFDGETKIIGIIHADSLGIIRGKDTANYKVEATIDGVKISEKINYVITANEKEYCLFDIYEGGGYGAG